MNKIAIMGFGIVGKGVYDIVKTNSNLEVVKVLDLREINEIKDITVNDYHLISEDENIDIVVECMGGDKVAYEAIKACLKEGKSVVTSNKETVALHLDEYLSLAKKHHCAFLFEASVGGGIPLLNPTIKVAKYDEIKGFMGILNGTTNYIITKMSDEGLDFNEALKLAQDNGFAEKDPSADLLGLDVVRKAAILASLAFNGKVDLNTISHYGIENLTKEIIEDITNQDKCLKMVAKASYLDGKFSCKVSPIIISKTNPLAAIKYENNGVTLNCKFNDPLTFIGKGAGRYPTASAIMQDIFTILDGAYHIKRSGVKPLANEVTTEGQYYIVINQETQILNNPSLEILQQASFVAEII